MRYTITGKQCLIARGLINQTQEEVADAIGVTATTISNYESGKTKMHGPNMEALIALYERNNIEFIGTKRAEGALIILEPE